MQPPATRTRESQPARRSEAARGVPATEPTPAPEPVARTAARAALDPRLLRAHDVLRLQRSIGNAAVGRLLQRTIVHPSRSMLYVPPAWLNVKFDDRAETVREVALGGWSAEKDELFANLVQSIGVHVDAVKEVKPPSGMLDLLKDDGYVLAGPTAKSNKVRQLRARLRDAVADTGSVTPLPDGADVEHKNADVFYPDQLRSQPTLLPNHLVKAPDDLTDGYDIAKVCALIALVKAEPRGALNAKLGLDGNLGSDAAYYQALHDWYYDQEGIQYDEPSTHGPLYAEWGYHMVFSGSTFFRNLPTVLRGPLSPDRKYIASIKGHVVYIRMKKAMRPGPALGEGELIADYFDFQSDPANYNISHDKDVEYIFEK